MLYKLKYYVELKEYIVIFLYKWNKQILSGEQHSRVQLTSSRDFTQPKFCILYWTI